jgi:hypothetical protein
MAQLDVDHSRRDHVLQRQSRGRTTRLPKKCPRCLEGTERVRYLLFGHFDGYADTQQALRNV